MVAQYWISICITVCLAALVYLLIHAVGKPAGGHVEIIISGDENAESIENTVMMAKQLSQRYFRDASICIRGGEATYVGALCKRYNICQKE